MVVSDEPVWGDAVESFVREYQNAVVYADMAGETILHEGKVRVLGNGWMELPTGRLLSPGAVHHIDTHEG